MKPITPLTPFPEFANINPGVQPGDPKYSQGFVPSDTFPAEWANYLFNRASKGVTNLNSAVNSLWSEVNTVLSNFNITPDASETDQLMEALTKLKAEAALAAHPVGSLYWTSSSDNPATTFGGGIWVQIKDKFILAAGDTYSNGTTGGEATVTLTVNQMPSHNHGGRTLEGGLDHTHSFSGTTTTDGGHRHTVDGIISNSDMAYFITQTHGAGSGEATASWAGEHSHSFSGTTGGASAYLHHHNVNTEGGGQAHENMPPYIVKYCWERTA